tara:strand:+ start:1948 stop:2601 length:654 start_codon:yes stop_codon:yes gene_type:complete
MSQWAVLFDWDGVVIDSSLMHEKSWEIVAEEYSLPLPEGHFQEGFGKRNETIIPEILRWTEDPDKVSEIAFAKESAYRYLLKEEGIEVLPGVREFLDWLDSEGIPCVIASSTPRDNLLAALPILDLENYFIGMISGDDVVKGKPNPEPFIKAAAIAGICPQKCLVLEDSHSGVEAGLSAGCRVIAVGTTHPLDSFSFAHAKVPDLKSLNFSQIKGWF